MDSSGSGYGAAAGFCEHGNEPSDCKINAGKFLDQLNELIRRRKRTKKRKTVAFLEIL
jgi:hypothetical protein